MEEKLDPGKKKLHLSCQRAPCFWLGRGGGKRVGNGEQAGEGVLNEKNKANHEPLTQKNGENGDCEEEKKDGGVKAKILRRERTKKKIKGCYRLLFKNKKWFGNQEGKKMARFQNKAKLEEVTRGGPGLPRRNRKAFGSGGSIGPSGKGSEHKNRS